MTVFDRSTAERAPPTETPSRGRRFGGISISARIAALTAAGLLSLVLSSFFLTQALYRSADRTAESKVLFDRAATA
ncbi:MAG TPA: hypothetical protein VFJ18_05095, partial [Pararhizobium sp.]|nr:hypothetical protein [Pararhizobium sp.]